jgi:hypothetical protein
MASSVSLAGLLKRNLDSVTEPGNYQSLREKLIRSKLPPRRDVLNIKESPENIRGPRNVDIDENSAV